MATSDRYTGLQPDFAAKVKRIERDLTAWCSVHWPNHSARMSEGFRTVARQQALYAQGRTKPGKIVTHRDGVRKKSNHQSGQAADIVGVTPSGALTWECPDAFWAYLGHLARAEGLVYGGDWKMRDMPHVEVAGLS